MASFYVNLNDIFNEELPGWKSQTKETKDKILTLLFNAKRHESPGMYCIPVSHIKAKGLDPARIKDRLKKWGIVEFLPEYWENRAQDMKFTPYFYDLMNRAAIREVKKHMVKPNPPKKPMKLCEMHIDRNPHINLDNLNHYIEEGWMAEEKDPEDKRDQAIIFRLYATAKNNRGRIPQKYYQPSDFGEYSARIYGTGTHAIQQAPRLIRSAMMDGYYDYDFENAHYAILNSHGEYAAIDHYVNNTKETRNKIAEETGLTYEQVKFGLIALLYGAKRGKHPTKSAIAKQFGVDKVDAFFYNPTVASIREEMKEAGVFLLQFHGVDPRTDFFRKLSLALQTEENRILSAAKEGEEITVPMFDGWIQKEDVNPMVYERRIVDGTGYHVRVTRERIAYEF